MSNKTDNFLGQNETLLEIFFVPVSIRSHAWDQFFFPDTAQETAGLI